VVLGADDTQMPSGIETSPKLRVAVINAISDALSSGGSAGGAEPWDGICSGSVPAATSVVAGADGGGLQSCGVQSAASACRGSGGGGAWAAGRSAGSSGWFGSSLLMTAPGNSTHRGSPFYSALPSLVQILPCQGGPQGQFRHLMEELERSTSGLVN
jgi:hypothetical protein